MRSIKLLFTSCLLALLCIFVDGGQYHVSVVGSILEIQWIEDVMRQVPHEIIPAAPSWEHFNSTADFIRATTASLAALVPPKPLLVVTNLLSDPALLDAVLAEAARERSTALVVVDERGALTNSLCTHFRFVIRVGYGPFSEDGALSRQPDNTLLVPLGVPDSFPRLAAFQMRPATARTFTAAFAGRVQNFNRVRMVLGLSALPGRSFAHVATDATSESTKGPSRLGVDAYALALADAALAPAPPGNVHPDSHRVFEALEAGAIPVVDSFYFRDAWAAPFPVVRVRSWDLRPLLGLSPRAAVEQLTVSQVAAISGELRQGLEGLGESWPQPERGRLLTALAFGNVSELDGLGADDESLSLDEALSRVEPLRRQCLAWWKSLKARAPRMVAAHIRHTTAAAAAALAADTGTHEANGATVNGANGANEVSGVSVLEQRARALQLSMAGGGDGVVVGAAAASLRWAKALLSQTALPRLHLVGRLALGGGPSGGLESLQGCAASPLLAAEAMALGPRVRLVSGGGGCDGGGGGERWRWRGPSGRLRRDHTWAPPAGLASGLFPVDSLALVSLGLFPAHRPFIEAAAEATSGEDTLGALAWWPKLRPGGVLAGPSELLLEAARFAAARGLDLEVSPKADVLTEAGPMWSIRKPLDRTWNITRATY